MSINVKYNGARFPDPQPFFTISDNPVIIGGKVDHVSTSVQIIGTITGNNLSALETQKKYLITGLSSAFKTLEIGSGSYSFAQPLDLSFQDSDLTTILPYSVNFILYQPLQNNGATTLYTGVSDLEDSWSFTEGENLIVEAVHRVSATSKKVDNQSNLNTARHFVTGRINNVNGDTSRSSFEQFAVFLRGNNTGFLKSRVEEIDRFRGVYSITDTFAYSIGEENIHPSGILNVNTNINWTPDGGLGIRVEGSLQGGLTGYDLLNYPKYEPVNTGMFTPNDAKYWASQAVARSKSPAESGFYGEVFNAPRNYEYSIDGESNLMNFSFEFVDPSDPRTKNTKHEYTASVNATKDSNTITVDVNGSISYQGFDGVFITGQPETGVRFAAVSGEFEKVNQYAIAINAYKDFLDIAPVYDNNSGLNRSPISLSVTKNPFESTISYNYTFDNNIDISTGLLENARFAINKTKSILTSFAQETISNGFSVQEGYLTIPSISINASANLVSGAIAQNSLNFLSGLIGGYLDLYSDYTESGILIQNDYSTGRDNISINRGIIYKI